MSQEPNLKHFAYKGRRYRLNDKGQVLQWRTRTDSFEMAWLPLQGNPALENIIKKLMNV